MPSPDSNEFWKKLYILLIFHDLCQLSVCSNWSDKRAKNKMSCWRCLCWVNSEFNKDLQTLYWIPLIISYKHPGNNKALYHTYSQQIPFSNIILTINIPLCVPFVQRVTNPPCGSNNIHYTIPTMYSSSRRSAPRSSYNVLCINVNQGPCEEDHQHFSLRAESRPRCLEVKPSHHRTPTGNHRIKKQPRQSLFLNLSILCYTPLTSFSRVLQYLFIFTPYILVFCNSGKS